MQIHLRRPKKHCFAPAGRLNGNAASPRNCQFPAGMNRNNRDGSLFLKSNAVSSWPVSNNAFSFCSLCLKQVNLCFIPVSQKSKAKIDFSSFPMGRAKSLSQRWQSAPAAFTLGLRAHWACAQQGFAGTCWAETAPVRSLAVARKFPAWNLLKAWGLR